jgi:hypothetical protein
METLKYNNAVLNIDNEDVYLTDESGEEYSGEIEDNVVTFWITDIEDPYNNFEFPKVFEQILEAGGEYSLSGDGFEYEIDIEIDLDILKKLYTVENNI